MVERREQRANDGKLLDKFSALVKNFSVFAFNRKKRKHLILKLVPLHNVLDVLENFEFFCFLFSADL